MQVVDQEVLADDKPWSKYLKLAEEKIGLSRRYIAIGEKERKISIFTNFCIVVLYFARPTTVRHRDECLKAPQLIEF